ncbi:hypothetical protein SAMN06269173_103405 [Hymenobacter mucosus]|uniref:Uncharacterized protein n=1 Tax=Hymenobacter mucosus TaxID=1411120 RepID=A0A238X2P2_9BACT|nr:hypothetical protein SAMN06269173_103405 [Hymenobacter mucosus]
MVGGKRHWPVGMQRSGMEPAGAGAVARGLGRPPDKQTGAQHTADFLWPAWPERALAGCRPRFRAGCGLIGRERTGGPGGGWCGWAGRPGRGCGGRSAWAASAGGGENREDAAGMGAKPTQEAARRAAAKRSGVQPGPKGLTPKAQSATNRNLLYMTAVAKRTFVAKYYKRLTFQHHVQQHESRPYGAHYGNLVSGPGGQP